MSKLRALAWVLAGVVVVLLARALAYSLEPSPMARLLEHRAGGPGLPIAVLGAAALVVGLAVAVVALAALGVRERALVEAAPAPRLRVARLLARAVTMFVIASIAFALFESTLHWREGLGWHGLHCLTGPVHRDAIPILASLSLLAAAVAAALEHVLAWMRRTVASIAAGGVRLASWRSPRVFVPVAAPPVRLLGPALGARAPPVAAR